MSTTLQYLTLVAECPGEELIALLVLLAVAAERVCACAVIAAGQGDAAVAQVALPGLHKKVYEVK